ncbi:hypothetical protein A8D94_15470 [Burkholderia cenocepacia]|nr:hypothetical protein A8D94_15470 [Burkholderia cenocepacia]
MRGRGGHGRASPAGRCGSRHGKDLGSSRAGPATWAGPIRGLHPAKETLINEPVVRITDEAGCNFQIDVGI